MSTRTVETGKDRRSFARDAGMGQVSLLSVLAGTLVALASFAVLLGIAAGILSAIGIDTADLTSNDWEQLGIGGGIVAALVLFLSYLFGGYIAGRMARRAGALNGGLVFLVAILLGLAVALVVGSQTDTEAVAENLRVLGVPTSGSEYGDIGTVAGIAALLAMLGGSVLGGVLGERWHGKLARRALDPDIGPEASARREMNEAADRRRQTEVSRPWATGQTATAQPAQDGDGDGHVGEQRDDQRLTVAGRGEPSAVRRGGDGPRRDRPLRSNSGRLPN